MTEKIKVLTMGDHPLSPSGVGTQTRYVCEALLKSEKFKILSLGGAVKHNNYDAVLVNPWKEDWKIIPVDGYGTPEMIRSIIRMEKPDILWFMTDPRFWGWLWAIENEIRPLLPMVYYHVWDNYPYPYYNQNFYLSNDHVATISKVSDDIVKTVAPGVNSTYLPHAVDSTVFCPRTEEQIQEIRLSNFSEGERDKFIVFWNNRNARRKQSGSLIYWFKEFLDKVGHDKATLLMHTDPKDPHGQDLSHIIAHLGLTNRQVLLSTQKISPADLASMYNMVDCTVNISDAEGFGLATLESLSCGTPIIVTMTGGLQEQVTDGTEWFGFPIFPSSKSIIGSQDVPYIYEDRINKDHFISALTKMYSLSGKDRQDMGLKGRQHVIDNYNFKKFGDQWVDLMTNIHEEHGSWETRVNYNGIYFAEVA